MPRSSSPKPPRRPRREVIPFSVDAPCDPLPRGWAPLVAAAKAARLRAYAPYSRFRVGAAFEGIDGVIYRGCNVENLSFGLTCCAERVAVQNAVASGCQKFQRCVVISDSKNPISPCGACRQVISEFAKELQILSITTRGEWVLSDLSVLLPRPSDGILG